MAFQRLNSIDARGGAFNNVHGDQINRVNFYSNPPASGLCELPPVRDAEYTRSGRVARCLQHTRKDVIDEITRLVDRSDARICWLKGPAGSGKSTISQTVAESYAAKNRLAASFFFLRGSEKRSSIARFIPSVTYQISISIPNTRRLIEDVLRREPSIFQMSFRHQLNKLLIEPIMAVHDSIISRLTRPKPWLIVIDALDECDDKDSMANLIQSVIDVFQDKRRLPVRFLCTSRIEEHLRKKLKAHIVYPLDLGDFDARVDIRMFFQSRFSAIRDENLAMRSIPLPWPSEEELEALVHKSEGSFIVAETLVNFIDDGIDLPHRKIQKALNTHGGLDTLYTKVLLTAPRTSHFDRVIGTIMLVSDPLPVTSLGYLLRLENADVLQALLGLQSILLIPTDDNEPVRLFHTSLRDFLTTKPRSGNLFIDPPTRHFCIATDCLTAIVAPPENGVFYDGVQEYACLHWCDHFLWGLTTPGRDDLFCSSAGTAFMRCLQNFATLSVDFWVNTMVFRGDRRVLDVLSSVISQLEMAPNCPHNLLWVSEDIKRRAKVKF